MLGAHRMREGVLTLIIFSVLTVYFVCSLSLAVGAPLSYFHAPLSAALLIFISRIYQKQCGKKEQQSAGPLAGLLLNSVVRAVPIHEAPDAFLDQCRRLVADRPF